MLKGEKINWMKFKMTTMMTKVRKMMMLLMKMRSLKTLRGNLDWCFVKLTSRIFPCFILTTDCQKKGTGRYHTKNRNLCLHKIQIKIKITVSLSFSPEAIIAYASSMKFKKLFIFRLACICIEHSYNCVKPSLFFFVFFYEI